MKDEIWTTRDGRKIAVGDMADDHVRMILRAARKRKEKRVALPEMTVGECQDMLSAEAYRNLTNSEVYFPLLGVYGSPELQKKYRR